MPYRPSAEVEAIVHARHGDPFAFLGMHRSSAGLYVRTFLPDAESVAVVESATGRIAARCERLHPAGVFVASMPDRGEPFRYRTYYPVQLWHLDRLDVAVIWSVGPNRTDDGGQLMPGVSERKQLDAVWPYAPAPVAP